MTATVPDVETIDHLDFDLPCERPRCLQGPGVAVWRGIGSYPCGCREDLLICDPCVQIDILPDAALPLSGYCHECGGSYELGITFGQCIRLERLP